ncbi:MAG: IS30 family transposase [Aliarcobacter sp.]|jgi:IS30 family transposase|nr:IS30 family transposase [Aliarcobacter sp.]
MKKFTQLTLKERYQISAYIKVGYTQNDIAKLLDKSQSTISREINRNSKYNKYQAEIAVQLTFSRHKKKNKFIKLTKKAKVYIQEKLKLDWSPEQISGVMKKHNLSYAVSYETIYQYIYQDKSSGGRLYFRLRHKNKKYHKRSNDYNTRGIIKNRVSIDKRPNIVERKSRVGDWEIDTVIGANHKGALVTIVDRKSKFTLIKNIPSKHAAIVSQATIDMLLPIRALTHTITSDNGKEFAYHEQVFKALDTNFYFANPYHSWERGLNEHTNGLIRQYLPKKTDFTKVEDGKIRFIQDRLNNRPRKVLAYKTPAEVFYATIFKKLSA